jgi:hypothetical protein
MAGSGKPVERTLENVGMKAARLFIDVDQPVFVACDDAADQRFQPQKRATSPGSEAP